MSILFEAGLTELLDQMLASGGVKCTGIIRYKGKEYLLDISEPEVPPNG